MESDKLFVELEEKRMKLDYEMMRMEQDRRREEADSRKTETRRERIPATAVFHDVQCSS